MNIVSALGDKDRSLDAINKTVSYQKKYKDAIDNSVANTTEYDDQNIDLKKTEKYSPEIILEDADTVSSALAHRNDGTICIHNFSSYINPGGGFIRGTLAQEEAICHESTLYNVLRKCNSFYDYNRKHMNRGLYLDRALYSHSVYLIGKDDDTLPVDVLTCAAPNRSVAKRFGVSDYQNRNVFYQRIKFCFHIVAQEKPDVFITGAYGCGVFGQDPKYCCTVMKLLSTLLPVKKLIFAIPNGSNGNYEAFKKELEI